MKRVVEKVTCKECGSVELQEVETIKNFSNSKQFTNSFSAVIVKKFKCGKCDSHDCEREYAHKDNKHTFA